MLDNKPGEDRALSPVIGVVLLVALTVILVAVVGGFVTDFGSSVEAAPNAQIGVNFDKSNEYVNVSHEGGSDINPETLKVEYEENGAVYSDTFNNAVDSPEEGLIQAGDEHSINVTDLGSGGATNVSSGETFRIIWTGESGNNREVLLEEIVP